MRLHISEIVGQAYILPSIKITYSRMLNGDLEFILGWLKYELVVAI